MVIDPIEYSQRCNERGLAHAELASKCRPSNVENDSRKRNLRIFPFHNVQCTVILHIDVACRNMAMLLKIEQRPDVPSSLSRK